MGWFSRLFRRKPRRRAPSAGSLFTATAPPTAEPATEVREATAPPEPVTPPTPQPEPLPETEPEPQPPPVPEPAPVPEPEPEPRPAPEPEPAPSPSPPVATDDGLPEPPGAVEAWQEFIADALDEAPPVPVAPPPPAPATEDAPPAAVAAGDAPGLGVRVHGDRLDRTGVPRAELTPSQAMALAQEGPEALRRRLTAIPEDERPDA